MAVERVLHVRRTPDGPAVTVRWIGTTWVERGPQYRRRRIAAAAGAVLGTLGAIAATAWLVSGAVRHSRSPGEAEVFGLAYAALAVPGALWGRHWLRHAPTHERDAGRGTVLGSVSVVLLPLYAGFGLAVLPRLFGDQFPGEERARSATLRMRAEERTPAAGA